MKPIFLLLLAAAALAGCTTHIPAPLEGPAVEPTPTRYSNSLACLEGQTANAKKATVGVGTISDKTGKFSLDDGGYKVSQGPDLMVVSALAKSKSVNIVERIDTRVVEWELKYANDKVLGDGPRVVKTPKGDEQLNYRAIYPGALAGSDYYIVGGITGLDYNIFSGGAEGSISGIGGGAREYRLLISVDLRLVDSKSSRIVSVASLQKQVVGLETKANVFRFFGNTLIDFNAGTKINEPLSMAVRAVLERAVFNLLGELYRLPEGECQKLARLEDELAAGKPLDQPVPRVAAAAKPAQPPAAIHPAASAGPGEFPGAHPAAVQSDQVERAPTRAKPFFGIF